MIESQHRENIEYLINMFGSNGAGEIDLERAEEIKQTYQETRESLEDRASVTGYIPTLCLKEVRNVFTDVRRINGSSKTDQNKT